MTSPTLRIALANLSVPNTREESVESALAAIREAGDQDVAIICFPECYVPGYRIGGSSHASDESFLNDAWAKVDAAAAEARTAVILGTERTTESGLHITARVTSRDGQFLGFQDKVQLDPSEELTYVAGTGRSTFDVDGVTFGVVICHEGWRYPETVRWAARNGAQVVFHPHFELVEDTSHRPAGFADPANTFHEKAALCRAAENSTFFATVNCAMPGSTTTSAVIDPDGSVMCFQPHGEAGLLIADIEPSRATRLLATRLRVSEYVETESLVS